MTQPEHHTDPTRERNDPNTDTAVLMTHPFEVFDAQDTDAQDPTEGIRRTEAAMRHLNRLTGFTGRMSKATAIGALVLTVGAAGVLNRERLDDIEWPPFNPQISKLIPDFFKPATNMPPEIEIDPSSPAHIPEHMPSVPTRKHRPNPLVLPPGIINHEPQPRPILPGQAPELAPAPPSVEPAPEEEETVPPTPPPIEEQPPETPPPASPTEEQPPDPPPPEEVPPTETVPPEPEPEPQPQPQPDPVTPAPQESQPVPPTDVPPSL